MSVTCIDISEHQGSIDFKKVKSAGVAVILMRIGYGNQVSQKDAYFERNYREAKAVGLKVGGYWYSYASSVADAKKEASACIQCVNGKSFDLPIYYDMEENKQASSHSRSELTNMAKAFCDAIKSSGHTPGVYGNPNWFSNHLNYTELRKLYSIWLAHIASSPGYQCDIWQYSWTQHIPGISGNVDANIIYNSSLPGGTTSANVSLSILSENTITGADIDVDAIDHYIITIDRRAIGVNYDKLKQIGVVGVAIEAGGLYTSSHVEQSFRNPNLHKQAYEASDADVPFALYMDARARSKIEANREMDELAFCVRKYPPTLGVWLKLDLTCPKSTNNQIIDTYYDRLVSLGLKDRIGFYVTKPQLQKIDWSKYYDKWYLWWNSHVDSVDEFSQLLHPEFFIL